MNRNEARRAAKAARYDIWARFAMVLFVMMACVLSSLVTQVAIDRSYWWAFIQYGMGMGLLLGAVIKIKYSLSAATGAALAIFVAAVMFWTERVVCFPALLFCAMTLIAVSFGKFHYIKMLEARVLLTKNSRRVP